jgi:hypothetical protein
VGEGIPVTFTPPGMLVLVPSRERPGNVARFAQAAMGTSSCDVLFILDRDDPLLNEAYAAAKPYQCRVLPRMSVVPKLNQAAAENLSYPVLMFTGDDTIPRTAGWDTLLTGAIAAMGGTGYAYPDGLARTDIPEHVAISSDIVRALGWFACPYMTHFCIDNAWADIGNGAECIRFVPEAVVEHMHWTQGKGPKDHVLKRAIDNAAGDYAGYDRWRSEQMTADIATVQMVMRQEDSAQS